MSCYNEIFFQDLLVQVLVHLVPLLCEEVESREGGEKIKTRQCTSPGSKVLLEPTARSTVLHHPPVPQRHQHRQQHPGDQLHNNASNNQRPTRPSLQEIIRKLDHTSLHSFGDPRLQGSLQRHGDKFIRGVYLFLDSKSVKLM